MITLSIDIPAEIATEDTFLECGLFGVLELLVANSDILDLDWEIEERELED